MSSDHVCFTTSVCILSGTLKCFRWHYLHWQCLFVIFLPLFGSNAPYFRRGTLLFSGLGSSFFGAGDCGGVLSRDGDGDVIGLGVTSSSAWVAAFLAARLSLNKKIPGQ